METAVIIPAHNEAASIRDVVKAALLHSPVIVVDDGSHDATGEIARSAGADVVRNEPNRGYDGAIQRGFERAAELGCTIVVTMDADGQHPSNALPRFLEPIRSGKTDMVLGLRPKTARLSETIFGFYTRLRFDVPDILCGLKSYRMELFQEHGRFDGCNSIGTELALWTLKTGHRYQTLEIPIAERLDHPRFDSLMRANWRILVALRLALQADLTGTWPTVP